MAATVYRQMLEVMTKRGGPYAGIDIPEFYALLEALFTPQQAEINNVVNMDRCFGSAVCASGCPQDAILMEARPGWQQPPGSVKDLVTALKKDAAARQT